MVVIPVGVVLEGASKEVSKVADSAVVVVLKTTEPLQGHPEVSSITLHLDHLPSHLETTEPQAKGTNKVNSSNNSPNKVTLRTEGQEATKVSREVNREDTTRVVVETKGVVTTRAAATVREVTEDPRITKCVVISHVCICGGIFVRLSVSAGSTNAIQLRLRSEGLLRQ